MYAYRLVDYGKSRQQTIYTFVKEFKLSRMKCWKMRTRYVEAAAGFVIERLNAVTVLLLSLG